MGCQLHCLSVRRFFGSDVHQTDDFQCGPPLAGVVDRVPGWFGRLRAQVAENGSALKMCRGSNVKDIQPPTRVGLDFNLRV